MELDISTIAFLASIIFATQTIAVFVQYRVNKTYSGLGWWLIGAILQALGFFLMLALNVQSIWLLSIFANPLIFSGQIFLNIGIRKFLDKKAGKLASISLVALYIIAYFYFIIINESIFGRSLVVSASSAVITLIMAYTLFHGRRKQFAGSAGFTASIFLVYGCFQIFIAIVTLLTPHIRSFHEIAQTPISVLAFIIPIVGSMLWTFGFILMVNQRLNAENIEEKEKLQSVFNLSPDAKLITRLGDGILVDVNAGFLAMTGYARDEMIGRSMFNSHFWENKEDMHAFIAELNTQGVVDNKEFAFQRKSGERFIGLISGRIIAIQDNAHIISVIHDITARKQADQEIRNLLAEKELILKEVHHRIKNNMNTIYSLLSLQAGSSKDPSLIAALGDTRKRIYSMMVLYDKLYTSGHFTDLSVKDYLPPLVDEIVSNFPNAGSVKVEKRIDDFVLGVKQLQTLGIIVNELLTNIMKYAFTGGEAGMITVSARRENDHADVIVEDNGKGIPESVDFENSTGFGLMLVGALTSRLNGTIRIERGNGTRIILSFAI